MNMNPVEVNVLITAITNHLFCTLSRKNFVCLNIFISELSKAMFATTLFRDLCGDNDKNKDENKNAKDEKK